MAVAALAGVMMGIQALQSLQQVQQGRYAAGVAATEAQSMREQAQETKFSAGQQIEQQDYAASHQLAAATAGIAASGISETEGSPELIRYTSANQQRLNDMYTRYAANVQAAGLKTEADITESEGQQVLQGAEIGAITGFAGAAIAPTTSTGGFGSSALMTAGTPAFNFIRSVV